MESEFDPHEAWARGEALGRSLVSHEPQAIGAGMLTYKTGMFSAWGENDPVVIVLDPPNLIIQKIDTESFSRIDPPLTITHDDIAKASFNSLRSPVRKDKLPLAIEAKLKLRDGQGLKLGVVHGGLHGANGPEDLNAKIIESCDLIIGWLEGPS